MRVWFLCLAFFVAIAANAEKITIDGALTEAEWGPSVTGEPPADGKVLMVHEGENVCFGLRAPNLGLANVNLWRGDELYVLHRSGSLGRAVYRRSGDTWERTEDFEWRMKGVRTKPIPPEALKVREKLRALKAERTGEAPPPPSKDDNKVWTPEEAQEIVMQHLEEHGWTSSTFAEPHSVEFKVALPPLGEGWKVSLQWMQKGPNIEPGIWTWPEGAKVVSDETAWQLVGGKAPETLDFNPEGWQDLAAE